MATKQEVREQLLNELVDELIEDCQSSEDLLGKDGILKQMTRRLVERMLQGEMIDHLGYEKNDPCLTAGRRLAEAVGTPETGAFPRRSRPIRETSRSRCPEIAMGSLSPS